MNKHNINMIDTEPLQAIFERTSDAICGLVKDDVVGRIGVRKQLFGIVAGRGLEQLLGPRLVKETPYSATGSRSRTC